MPKSNRPEVNIRLGQQMGDRLGLRNPAGSSGLKEQLLSGLRPFGVHSVPGKISVGHFIELDDPDGAVAFMPNPTPNAVAALGTDIVQRRICNHLARLMTEQLQRNPDSASPA